MIELMVVIAIIGLLVAMATPHLQVMILMGRLEEAKPYLAAIAAKERIYYDQNGQYFASTLEQELEDTLGVDLRDAADFCFIVVAANDATTSSYISTSITADASSFEVWGVLRNSSTTGVVTVDSLATTCTPADLKNDPTGWVDDSGETGGEGRVVALRYPPPSNGQDSAERKSRSGVKLDWVDGISLTDPLL